LANGDASSESLTAGNDGNLPEDGVIVSDELAADGVEQAIASADGLPSASDSFFVQLDTENSKDGLDSSDDVPLPAALPMFAAALGLMGLVRRRRQFE